MTQRKTLLLSWPPASVPISLIITSATAAAASGHSGASDHTSSPLSYTLSLISTALLMMPLHFRRIFHRANFGFIGRHDMPCVDSLALGHQNVLVSVVEQGPLRRSLDSADS